MSVSKHATASCRTTCQLIASWTWIFSVVLLDIAQLKANYSLWPGCSSFGCEDMHDEIPPSSGTARYGLLLEQADEAPRNSIHTILGVAHCCDPYKNNLKDRLDHGS